MVTPPHAVAETAYRSPMVSQTPSAHSSYQTSSPSSFQAGTLGSPYASPDYPDGRAGFQPDPQARQQPQVSVVGVHALPGSPRTLHRTVATNTPPSPGFGRRAANPAVASVPGSPGLGRHTVSPHAPPGSPSLARHQMAAVPPGSPMYGYSSPEERRPTLSRQSSASGYQPPSTPSFPVSPAYYPGTSTPHSSSPDSAAYRQGSPTPQPALPEKRRMSAGERSNSLPNYATVNGKASSPLSSGMSSPSSGSAVAFSHTLPDFSKFSMPGKGCRRLRPSAAACCPTSPSHHHPTGLCPDVLLPSCELSALLRLGPFPDLFSFCFSKMVSPNRKNTDSALGARRHAGVNSVGICARGTSKLLQAARIRPASLCRGDVPTSWPRSWCLRPRELPVLRSGPPSCFRRGAVPCVLPCLDRSPLLPLRAATVTPRSG